MHFVRINVTFYDTVNMIHDTITTANLFLYTAKFMFDGARNNKTEQLRHYKIKEYLHSVVVNQKYLTRLGK